MLCPKCQHRNPDENRFCGNCGCDLTKTAQTIYPREGYDEADLPPVSNVENEIPHFRRDVPPLRQSEYGPPIESSSADVEPARPSIVERPTKPVIDEKNSSHDTAPEPPPESMRSYGSSTGILFNLAPKEPARIAEPTPRVPIRDSEHVEPERFVSEPVRRSEGIHGPSFLGLADGVDPDFLDDIDEPESHSLRNWFLFALVIVIVLAAVQWRNIRDTGLNFAGSMKLNLPHKKGEQPKPTDAAATDHPSENGPANNGKPEIVVDQENKNQPAQNAQTPGSGAANNTSPQGAGAQQQGAAVTPPDTSAKTNVDQGAPNATTPNSTAASDNAATKPASADAQPSQKQLAKNNAANTNDTKAADDSGDNSSDSSNAEPAAKTPAKPARAARTPANKPVASSAGAEELARANSASSPETAAKWLWASTSKGNLDAPVRLADMYATGRGVAKDCEQATVLLRSSARRGNPRASARLGMYYATGQCVAQDRPQAWHWLALAHQRDPNSDWITQYRQRLWSEMSPDERARAGNGPNASASE